MSEDPLRQLQIHTQRALAAAHLVEQLRESPATARLIAAGRVFLNRATAVISEHQPRPAALPAPAAPTPPVAPPAAKPLKAGDEIEYEVAPGFWRRACIKHVYDAVLLGERAFWCEWRGGSFEALESECRRV